MRCAAIQIPSSAFVAGVGEGPAGARLSGRVLGPKLRKLAARAVFQFALETALEFAIGVINASHVQKTNGPTGQGPATPRNDEKVCRRHSSAGMPAP